MRLLNFHLRISKTWKSFGGCYNFLLISYLLLGALQLSVADSTKDAASQSDMSKLLADQSFVSSILASVCLINPGIICFVLYLVIIYCFCSFLGLTRMTLLSKICWPPCKISLRLVFLWNNIHWILEECCRKFQRRHS